LTYNFLHFTIELSKVKKEASHVMMPLELKRHFRLFYLFFIVIKTTISFAELRRLFFSTFFWS